MLLHLAEAPRYRPGKRPVDSLFRRFTIEVFIVGLRIRAGMVNDAVPMIRRRIERVKLQWNTALIICVAVVIETCLVLAASKATHFFRANPTASVWLDRVLGSVRVGLGIRLALSKQRR